MRKLLVLLLSSLSLSLSASLIAPEKLGDIAVLNCPNGFAVIKDKKIHHLGPEAVDASILKMDFKQRNMYLIKGGSLALNQTNDGDFLLRIAPKLKGAGPISGAIAYWLTKSLCWGGVVTAATAATGGMIAAGIATGGAAVGASAGAIATVTGTATAAAGAGIAMAGGGAAGAVGATIAAGGMAATAGGITAATTATAAGATAVGAAGLVASIETASTAAGFFFTIIPWLP